MTVNYDTDGTPWITVRFTVDVPVIATSEEEALYFANLALPDYDFSNYAEVLK
jgi:hypothetical protein